jgi:hypothetical protein
MVDLYLTLLFSSPRGVESQPSDCSSTALLLLLVIRDSLLRPSPFLSGVCFVAVVQEKERMEPWLAKIRVVAVAAHGTTIDWTAINTHFSLKRYSPHHNAFSLPGLSYSLTIADYRLCA